jgi:hypothetical protein
VSSEKATGRLKFLRLLLKLTKVDASQKQKGKECAGARGQKQNGRLGAVVPVRYKRGGQSNLN